MHRVDIHLILDAVNTRAGGVGGLLDVELLVAVHRLLVHPHEHRLKITVLNGEVVRVHYHLATRDVDFVFEGNGDTQRRKRLFDFPFISDNTLHLRGFARRQSHHRVAHTHHTRSHLSAEAAEVEVRAQHVLHRIAEVFIVAVEVDGHGLQVVEQALAVIPRGAVAFLHHIVAIESRQGNAGDIRDAQRLDKLVEVGDNLIKHRLVEVHQVHLVYGKHKVLDAQQGDKVGVTTGLCNHPRTCIHKNDCRIGCRAAGNHIAGVLLVSRSVGDDKLSVVGAEIAISHINGDALLALRLQSVEEQRIVDVLAGITATLAVALKRIELVFINLLTVEKQSTDECRFSVVDTSGGEKPQQVFLFVLVEKLLDI